MLDVFCFYRNSPSNFEILCLMPERKLAEIAEFGIKMAQFSQISFILVHAP